MFIFPVGAGAAGGTLAARLSEDNVTVLVLEAGAEESYGPDMELPINSAGNMLTKHAWLEPTVPQKHGCQGMIDQVSQ